MAAEAEDLPPRVARWMMWAALALLILVRLVSGVSEGVPWTHLLITAAPYPAIVVILARPHHGARARFGLLAAVAVLYALPFLLVGTEWSWLPWPLAVAVLCLLPGRAAWPLFGLIVLAAGAGVWLSGDGPLRALQPATATATDGLILFSLYALSDTISRLHATREGLARLAAARERSRLGGELRETVGRRLRVIADRLEQGDVRDAVEIARRTLADIRATAGEYRTAESEKARPVESPRLPALVLLAVLVIQSVKVLASGMHNYGDPLLLILGVPLVSAMITLQMAQLRRPTRAKLALIALTIVPVALPASYLAPSLCTFMSLWGFCTGAVLAGVRPPRSWALALLLFAGYCSLFFYPPPVPSVPGILADTVSHVILAWLVYSLTRLAGLVVLLKRAQHDLARAAAAAERVRIARDLHDVLGFTLSAVALRGELAMQEPERAETEQASLATLVRQALAEFRSITGGRVRLRPRDEIAAARQMLETAGIRADITVDEGPLPDALAAVVRESVTNVLRHSTARFCAITVTVSGDAVRLRVVNDGVATPGRLDGGSGLAGLAERAGGRLSAGHLPDGRFEVVAEFRSDPACLGGDADGVDPVPRAQLGDG
ncbi:sensor histidine kinase [Nonomuraea helvata]|uniref:Sensor histidine kinase n=1 Tax=Nonomuraea helvata TaxID=37484 RepID=A0ABV5SCX7_9ACTN